MFFVRFKYVLLMFVCLIVFLCVSIVVILCFVFLYSVKFVFDRRVGICIIAYVGVSVFVSRFCMFCFIFFVCVLYDIVINE